MARRVLVISLSVVILSGLTIGLSLLFGRDLERRTAVERELAHLPLSDMPTGLPNRRRFDKALEVAWKNVRGTRSPLSLLAVSADHFKRYNDNFCHVVGNEVLQGLARCLAAGGH